MGEMETSQFERRWIAEAGCPTADFFIPPPLSMAATQTSSRRELCPGTRTLQSHSKQARYCGKNSLRCQKVSANHWRNAVLRLPNNPIARMGAGEKMVIAVTLR